MTPNCDATLSDAALGRDAALSPSAALGGDAELLTPLGGDAELLMLHLVVPPNC